MDSVGLIEFFDASYVFEEEGDESGLGLLGGFGKDGLEARGEVGTHVVGHLHAGEEDLQFRVLLACFGDDAEQVFLFPQARCRAGRRCRRAR